MRKPGLIFALSIVPLLAGLTLWWSKQGQAASPVARSAADAAELDRMRHELEQIRNESGNLRQLLQGVAREAAARPAPDPDETAARSHAAANPGASAKPPPPSHEEYLSYVETEFTAEPVDRAWSARQELSSKIPQALPDGSSLRALDCRSSMCRLETAHRNLEAYQEFTKSCSLLGGEKAIWTGPAVFQVTHQPARDGDELVAVAYLARNSLPVLEPQ